MELDREWVEEILREKIVGKAMIKLSEMSSEPAVGTGENFNSSIERVHLRSELADGQSAKTSVIVKRKPQGELLNSYLEAQSFFPTEIKMYTEVLPALREALQEQGVLPVWPELLGLKDNILIFSDLKTMNYRCPNRKIGLDMPHILLVIRAIAQFHSASVVIRRRGLLDPSTFKPMYFARNTDFVRRLMAGGVKRLAQVMAAEWGSEWSDLARKIQKKADKLFEELVDLAKPADNRLNVLCHGDIWNSNIMFKYSQDADSPVEVKFVDYQLSHFNSFSCDLNYFLACSTNPDLYNSNYSTILETYADALRDSLTFHGCPELAPALSEVEAEMSRTELMRFFFLVCCMPVVTAECKDPIDFDALFLPDGIAHSPNIFRVKSYQEGVRQEFFTWDKAGLFL